MTETHQQLLATLRNAHAPYRTRVAPFGNVLGRVGPNLPSRSHPVFGASGELPGGQPTFWSPFAVTVAHSKPLNRTRIGPPQVERSPGAWFTPPGLFQLIGIPQPSSFLRLPTRPAAGRTGTPPVRHTSINPFPGARLPLPTNPAPAAFRGVV
ncbi:MAG: hypothetical protein ACRD2H_13905 [Terriglobales bacterium]